MKTLDDIVREMRDWDCHSWMGKNEHEHLVELADRIEKAWRKSFHDEAVKAAVILFEAEIKEMMDENAKLKESFANTLEEIEAMLLCSASRDSIVEFIRSQGEANREDRA